MIELRLNNNQLDRVNPYLFKNLNKLKKLLLNDNKLHYLDGDKFQGLVELEELNITFNNLNNILPGTFNSDLRNLKLLNLSHNKLCFNKGLEYFSNLVNLEQLCLNNNVIDQIEKHTFNGLINLKLLNLSFNNIKIINKDTFQHLENLENCKLNKKVIRNNNLII